MTATSIATRLEALGRRDPTLAPMLVLYETALREAADRAWDAVVEPGTRAGRQPAAAEPRLAGAVLALDPARAGDWVARLTSRAGGLADGAVGACAARLDPVDLILAAVRLDEAALERLAVRAAVLPETVAALAHLAALPVLAAAGRRLGPASREWTHGTCPTCGAWPTLAELRGIENERHLRCGRCGADWSFAFLCCPFCGTTDHEQLGSLVLEGGADRRKVDVCRACDGFLKAVPTLTALEPLAVVVEDLANVDLDLVALDRGFVRPGPAPSAPLDVTLAARATS